MYALITGASNGIGREIAKQLAKHGYGLVLVSRDRKALDELADEVDTKTVVIPLDLSSQKNCLKLYHMLKDKPIDILVNNAGFGCYGEFAKTKLSNELNMIGLNVCAVHILTKLFVRKMLREGRGYILNVASLAAFAPGPYMAAYYSTKSYVLKLTESVAAELRHTGKSVSVSAFCPGPVATDFNNRAGVKFSIKPIDSGFAAYTALNGMFGRKTVIFPRRRDGLTAFAASLAPRRLTAVVCGHIQKRKSK